MMADSGSSVRAHYEWDPAKTVGRVVVECWLVGRRPCLIQQTSLQAKIPTAPSYCVGLYGVIFAHAVGAGEAVLPGEPGKLASTTSQDKPKSEKFLAGPHVLRSLSYAPCWVHSL